MVKFGYTPAASLSLSVEASETETPEPAPEQGELIGFVISYNPEVAMRILQLTIEFEESFLEMEELVQAVYDKIGKAKIAGFLITDTGLYVLVREDLLDAGNYRVKGDSLTAICFENKKWVIFDL